MVEATGAISREKAVNTAPSRSTFFYSSLGMSTDGLTNQNS